MLLNRLVSPWCYPIVFRMTTRTTATTAPSVTNTTTSTTKTFRRRRRRKKKKSANQWCFARGKEKSMATSGYSVVIRNNSTEMCQKNRYSIHIFREKEYINKSMFLLYIYRYIYLDKYCIYIFLYFALCTPQNFLLEKSFLLFDFRHLVGNESTKNKW